MKSIYQSGTPNLKSKRKSQSRDYRVREELLQRLSVFMGQNELNNEKCYSSYSTWWRGCGETGTLLHCWWECKPVQPLWKTIWRFLKKLKIELPYNPATALLGIYLKDTKMMIQRCTCIPMFIAALSTIAKLWKEPKCPSIDELIKM